MEALMRWQHPERGFVSPVEFISIAESNGLIHELSRFVLEQALMQLRSWRDMGWKDLRMAINVSPLELRRSSIFSDILTAIDRVGVPRDRLEIELTESSLIV
jgi:EAL domain-containing protein (putative c-di-GMP-specific phosphodiesterase class I)